MRMLVSVIGLVLIIAGVLIFAYQGFTYTKHENVAQVGDFKITADTTKTVYFPPISGGASLVAGIVLVAIGRFRRQ